MGQITFDDVVKLVDQLTEQERIALQEHLSHITSDGRQTEDRVAALAHAVALIREGLTDAELDEMEWAMNYEFKRKDDPYESPVFVGYE